MYLEEPPKTIQDLHSKIPQPGGKGNEAKETSYNNLCNINCPFQGPDFPWPTDRTLPSSGPVVFLCFFSSVDLDANDANDGDDGDDDDDDDEPAARHA